ncbi:MAG: protein meaA, partial [Pseudomonadota bacterium]
VNAAVEESVHVIGLSILSGSHRALIEDVMDRMDAAGIGDIPLVVGGIIPDEDVAILRARGVARIYTPKDFELNRIMEDIVALVGEGAKEAA